MKACCDIICKKELIHHIREQIEFLICHCGAELTNIDENRYWKEDQCVQILADIRISQNAFEKFKKTIELIWNNGKEVTCTETQEYIELAIYSSIPEILQKDRIFLVLNVEKAAE